MQKTELTSKDPDKYWNLTEETTSAKSLGAASPKSDESYVGDGVGFTVSSNPVFAWALAEMAVRMVVKLKSFMLNDIFG